MKWTRDRYAHWSDCGRYCVQKTASTAIGPWCVTYDPEGENAGWGPMIVRYSQTMRDAKAAVEMHAAGTLPENGKVEVPIPKGN